MITENALNLLEFHKLLRIISKYSHSEASRKAVGEITPLANREEIEKRLGQVHQIRRMSQENDPLRLSAFSDIGPLFDNLRPEGAVLDAKELSLFTPFLTVLSDTSSQLGERIDLTLLKEISNQLTGFPHILTLLKRSIDSDGNILDTASFLLAELRGKVRQLEGRVRRRLEEMMRDERVSLFLQDNFITERSGRWVIPVRMDSKGQVPGVVHD
ncbi:MAG TPA: hypothetical protein VEI46_06945, partial [Thermodesulfovibrionales bacterium]|nr:hypothetical protein [Thermodesulfovibrionales bacterium]